MQKINLEDVRPYVRFSKTMILPYDFSTNDVHACDIRLVYFYSGAAKVKMNDRTYHASRGSLFLYPSSTKYSIINTNEGDTKIMSINFDYITDSERSASPIPTVSDKLWNATDALEDIVFEDIPQLGEPLHLETMQSLEPIFSEMTNECVSPKMHDTIMLRLLMHQVLIYVARRVTLGAGQKRSGFVDQVIDYIQENYASDLSNESIGKYFNYHPNYINRVVQKRTGQSLHQYVLSCRVSKALDMLQTTNLSITEVAERVGFSSIKHFSQTFKSIYGYSPIHFRD